MFLLSKKNKLTWREKWLFLIFIIYGVLSLLDWSQFDGLIPELHIIYLYYQIITVPILFILFLGSHPSHKILIPAIIIFLFALYATIVESTPIFLMFVSFFYAGRNIKYRVLFKTDIVFKIITFLGIYFAYRIGYLTNVVVNRGEGIRQSFGFKYPTYVMYVVLIIAIEWLLIRKEKITWLEVIIILVIGSFINKFADSRGETIALFIACIGGLLLSKFIKIQDFCLNNKIVKVCLIILPEIICLLNYILVSTINIANPLYNIINKFTSSRLNIFQYYLNEYGLRFFPRKLALNYLNYNGSWLDVIDNSYLYLGILFGVIILLIYLGIFSFLIKNAIDNKNVTLIAIMCAFVILNMVEYVSLMPVVALYCLTWKTDRYETMSINQ